MTITINAELSNKQILLLDTSFSAHHVATKSRHNLKIVVLYIHVSDGPCCICVICSGFGPAHRGRPLGQSSSTLFGALVVLAVTAKASSHPPSLYESRQWCEGGCKALWMNCPLMHSNMQRLACQCTALTHKQREIKTTRSPDY